VTRSGDPRFSPVQSALPIGGQPFEDRAARCGRARWPRLAPIREATPWSVESARAVHTPPCCRFIVSAMVPQPPSLAATEESKVFPSGRRRSAFHRPRTRREPNGLETT
jgi:hypothetical protein